MAVIIDRRNNKGKSSENRRKFLKRVKASIKEGMSDLINNRKIKDMASEGGKIKVQRKGINEPGFRNSSQGGNREWVSPGNKDFITGDQVEKPKGGQGQGRGRQGSPDGEGEDDFMVEIDRNEFLEYFFEDLELPDMIKTSLMEIKEFKQKNAGWTTSGSPSKLSVIKSLKKAYERKIALGGPYSRGIKEAEKEIESLKEQGETRNKKKIQELEDRIAELKAKRDKIPFIDPIDLRYHASIPEPVHVTSATMVCIMDNSGSMGEHEKTVARKFFALLYMFLSKKYEKINLIFIYHTDKAKEVSEEDFFNSRENGGTVVSSALDLLKQIIEERLAGKNTNVYVCQASDGDNVYDDNPVCHGLMSNDILPNVQYYSYIQIDDENNPRNPDDGNSLWSTYKDVANNHKNFSIKMVRSEKDIYPVFRELFEKKS